MRLTVAIDRQRVHARHGLLPQETRVGNMFEISVSVWYEVTDNLDEAAMEDISSTVNYAELADLVMKVMASPRQLLETVAIALRKAIVEKWPELGGGSITVVKLTPPISAVMRGATVSIEW